MEYSHASLVDDCVVDVGAVAGEEVLDHGIEEGMQGCTAIHVLSVGIGTVFD